jgi:hypothetical protein
VIVLSWAQAQDTESGISRYRVYRSTSSTTAKALVAEVSGAAISYTDPSGNPGSTYYYQISEVNGAGLEGSRSAEVSELFPSSLPPDPSLLRYYKLDEKAGVVAADSSANLVNGPAWTSGKINGGLQLDGINDYVETGFNTNLAVWTVSVWVKSPMAPNGNPASGPINRDRNFQVNWNHPNSSHRGAAEVSVNGVFYGATFGSLDANTWYHLVATYDGETLRARDGVLTGTNTSPSGPASAEASSMKFGRHASAAQYFGGTIDEVRIYNRALTASEVSALP